MTVYIVKRFIDDGPIMSVPYYVVDSVYLDEQKAKEKAKEMSGNYAVYTVASYTVVE